MSLWRTLVTFFSGVVPGVGNASSAPLGAEERLIEYLVGFVARDDLITSEQDQHTAARKLSVHPDKELAYAKLYLALENFIVSNKPLVTKREFKNKQELREQIVIHIPIEELSVPVRLIFLPEVEQAAALFGIVLPQTLDYIRRNLGDAEMQAALQEAVQDSALRAVPIVDGTFAPEDVLVTLAHLSPIEVRVHLKKVYGALLGKVTQTFGIKALEQVTKRIYETIASAYDRELVALFLESIPEGILEPQKLLSLSRAELETRVMEATTALRTEKEGVEQKVVERTEQLNQKINELNLANDRLRELDKIKTEFISVAAHQLRTPLSAVKWTLSVLTEEKATNLTPEQRSLLMKGYISNERMISLVNEMLVVTRIESGKMPYTFSSTQLETLIEGALNDFQVQARARHIALMFEKPPTPLPRIAADADKLQTVIQNLVDNAFSYTKDEGRVVLTAVPERDGVRFSVTDTGVGIPSGQQSSIFNKFFRADNATKVKTDGSGLGLFIAKSIIEKHNGTIGFESVEGKGSTFYFTVPFATAATLDTATTTTP